MHVKSRYKDTSIKPFCHKDMVKLQETSMMIYDTTDKAAAKKQLEALQVHINEANELS
jgi:hypothetical protein